MDEADKGCPMTRMGASGWVFLLVPAYPGSPRPTAVKRLCVCVYFTLHTEKRVKQTCTCWWKSLQSWSHSSAGIHVQCVRGMHPLRQPASAHNAGLKSPRYGCCHDNIYTALCNSICIIYTLPFTFHIPPSNIQGGTEKTRAYTGYANVWKSYGFTGVECRSLKTV